MPDSENKKPELNESPEPSSEPSQTPNDPQGGMLLPPGMGLREVNATYEMLVAFRTAIKNNQHWSGTDCQAVAMGLQMVQIQESQYRAQVERMRIAEKEAVKRARQAIKHAGGQVNGDNGNVPAAPTTSTAE